MAKKKTIQTTFNELNIPEEHDTDKKKCKYLLKKIRKEFSKLTNSEKNSTKRHILLGQELTELKNEFQIE